MDIIPAIDIIDGKCVRLTQGDYLKKKIYNTDPVAVARQYEDAGLTRLHLVDLDGAKAKAVQNWSILEKIVKATNLSIDFGGGINSVMDVAAVLNSGATYATVGSIAVNDEGTFVDWIQKFGAGKFVLGADVKGLKLAVHGWQELTQIDIFTFIDKYVKKGITQIFCTDISKDGKLQGPSTKLYKEIVTRFPSIYFIASGGVSSMQDLLDLGQVGCKAAIVGKAIYEDKISVEELVAFAKNQNN